MFGTSSFHLEALAVDDAGVQLIKILFADLDLLEGGYQDQEGPTYWILLLRETMISGFTMLCARAVMSSGMLAVMPGCVIVASTHQAACSSSPGLSRKKLWLFLTTPSLWHHGPSFPWSQHNSLLGSVGEGVLALSGSSWGSLLPPGQPSPDTRWSQ